MRQDEEREWVRRAAAGDRAAFTALVARYWRPVRAWLYGLCNEFHTAEDLTQDAFLAAWSGLAKLDEFEAFRVWLFRIARNGLLARQRGPKGIPIAPLPLEIAAPSAEPLVGLLEREGTEALRAAVGRLPELYREAYLLWANADLSYGEMAQVLETPAETSRWRVYEARKRLIRDLGEFVSAE